MECLLSRHSGNIMVRNYVVENHRINAVPRSLTLFFPINLVVSTSMRNVRLPGLSLILNVIIFLSETSLAQVNSNQLQSIFEVFQNVYSTELLVKKESLVFNRKIGAFEWVDIDLRLASYVQIRNEENHHLFHEITIVGGILKLQGFDADAAALVLCHELGHGLGGPPYKTSLDSESEGYLTSTEGQADYFATSECLPKIWSQLPLGDISLIPQGEAKCRHQFDLTSDDYKFCVRSFAAMKGFIKLREREALSPISISFDNHETQVAKDLDISSRYYPTPQCRLDTLMAGALKLPRPRCWFPGDQPELLLRTKNQ